MPAAQRRRSFRFVSPQSNQRRRIKHGRRLLFESLEARRLLAVDWRNPVNSLDISGDGFISPVDPLQVINELNLAGPHALAAQRPAANPFWDANGDQFISPVDALQVINALNANQTVPYSLSEGPQLAAEQNVTITVGQTAGTRTYRLQVTPEFGTPSLASSSQDLFAIYLVDPRQPDQTLLDRGTPGTTLFTLSATGAEFAPGRVRWDGEIVEIDLSAVTDRDTAELRLQLLNGDGVGASRITVKPLSNEVNAEGVASPVLLDSTTPSAAGTAFNVTGVPAANDVAVRVENVRYNSATKQYAAELRLQNQGDNLGRSIAVEFPGLPSGVTLRNPSGTTNGGTPYINFAPAISRGGLSKNARSERLLVEFGNPSQVPFSLTPQIFAAANQPPTLAAISPLTVMPGGSLTTQLTATDPDGDAITFSLRATGSASASPLNLPTGTLRANGTLAFTPTTDQVGTHTFDVVASDGALEARRTVTLNVVADPVITTRVSGKVLQVNGQPLAGMRVESGAVQGLTSADGSFTLDLGSGPIVSDTIKIRGELFPGSLVYPFIAEKLPLVLEHDVFAGVNNVIDRPIFLPSLDLANGKTIDPMSDTLVTTEAIPDATVMVHAGTLMNQQGSPFTGVLSITEVPPSLTPAALPEGLRPDLVVTVQPGEMVFTAPAPMTFPNRSGWAPGTLMDLWSINPVTGEFDDVGDMRVSADGSVIETISGGVRNSSWHFPAPPPPTPRPPKGDPHNPDNDCDECPDSSPTNGSGSGNGGGSSGGSGGSSGGSNDGSGPMLNGYLTEVPLTPPSTFTPGMDIADPPPMSPPSLFGSPPRQAPPPKELKTEVSNHSGAVLGMRSLSTYVVGDQPLGLSLTYDSLRADPRPIVHFGFDDVTASSNLMLTSKISVANGSVTLENPGVETGTLGLSGGEHLWSLPANGGNIKAALQVDLRDVPSGRYTSTITQGLQLLSNDSLVGATSTSEYKILHVNTMASPFGAGWGLAGLQEIVENSDGSAMIINGDGGEKLFDAPPQASAAYVSPPGDFSTLVKLQDNSFRRTDENGTVYEFNTARQLVSVTNRLEKATTFQYDAQQRLTSITDFTGLVTQFAYTGDKVSAITDPAGRVTQLEYDAAGNLTQVTDPDGTSDQYAYDAGHHLTMKQDKLGRQEQLFYDFAGRLERSVAADGSERRFAPLQTQGLLPPTATIRPHDAPVAQVLGEPFARISDANGNIRSIQLDRAGQQVDGRDAVGRLPAITRNDDNLVTQVADGRGRITLYEYDTRGNVVSVHDENSGGTVVIGALTESGEQDVYEFMGVVGQRIYYDALPSASDDLRMRLLGPSGQTLSFDHDEANHGPFTLAEAGTYRLELLGNNGATGDYAFSLYEPPINFAPLTFGTDITGTIDLPGELDVFTFTATVGQRIFYDALTSAEDDLRVRLISPTGQQIISNHDEANDGPHTLVENGLYLLNLSGSGDAIGDYHFRVVEPTIAFAPLTLGADVTGTIDLPGDLDVYTFTGTVGQRIFYDALTSADDDLRVQLISPTGQQIIFNHDEANDGPHTLAENGMYRLNLSGSGDAIGDYHFRVVEPTINFAPLTLGADVTGTIDLPGDLDVYTFTGTVGQRIFYDAQTSAADDLRVQLISPTGQQVIFNHDEANDGPHTLAENGSYRLNLFGSGDAIGDYHFQLLDLSSQSLMVGTPVTGTLSPGVTAVAFQHVGARGQRLLFDSSQAGNGSWFLYGPASQLVAGNVGLGTDFVVTLPADGPYVLQLSGTDGTNSVPFNFQVNDISDPAIVPNGFDTNHAGTIAAGQQAIFNLDAPAGLTVFFDSHIVANSLRAELRDPQNQPVFFSDDTTDRGPHVLQRGGTYTLTITGDTPASTGSYDFTMLDLINGGTALTAGTPVNGNLQTFEERVFTFAGIAGQTFFYDGLDTDFDNVSALLFTPSGVPLFTINSDANGGPITLTESGDYRLLIDNNLASTPDFSFRITTPTVISATLAFDTPIDDALTIPGDEKQYTFTGTVGQRIFYDSLQSDFSVATRVQLVTPSGVLLFNENTDRNYGPFTLTEADIYKVLVTGDNEAVGTFSFQMREPTVSSQSLTIGSPVNDSLTIPGDQKEYTFTGSVGQRIFYDSLQSDFSVATRVQLVTPSGVLLFNENTDRNYGPFTLTEGGTYKLLVTGDDQAIGTFSFRIIEPTFVSQPLTIGTPVNDGLTNPGDRKEYTFTGSVGQRIFYDGLQSDFSIATRVRLVTPSGVLLINENTDRNYGPFTLTEAGDYKLLVTGDDQTTGTFSFRVIEPTFVSQPLMIGSTISDAITNPGDRKEYTFTGAVGQRIFYDGLQSDFSIATRVRLVTPSGVLLINENTDRNYGPFSLTESGTYSLLVTGDDQVTGTFSFRMLEPGVAPPAPFDTTINGIIAPGLGSTFYQFTGMAGQRLFFDALQTASLTWGLYGPNNTFITSAAGFTDLEATLPVDGTYLLELRGTNAGADVPFQFRMVTPETVTTPLAIGVVTTGTIVEPGETDVFTFAGALGQKVFYDSQQNDFAAIKFRIVSPSGATVLDKNSDDENFPPLTLLETGVYQLIVDGTGDVTGDYRFRLLNGSTAPLVSFSNPNTGTLNPGLASDIYRIEGRAGQRVRFNFTGSTVGFGWALDTPSDFCIACGMSPGLDQVVTLPSTGTYILSIRGTIPAESNAYVFTATDISDAPVTNSGLPIAQSGNLTPSQELTSNFTATAGTQVLFDSLDVDSDAAVVELRDPQNTVVFSQSAGNDIGPVILTRSGSYTLTIRNGSATAVADYGFRLIDLATVPTVPLNVPVNGELSVPFETDVFKLDVVAGQRFYLDTRGSNLGTVRHRLIGPDGNAIFDSTTNVGVGPLTITRSGRFTLAIGGTETAAGNYSFRLFDVLAEPELEFNQLITDATIDGVEADVFRFTGEANQTVAFVTTSPVLNSRGYLYDSSNQLLATLVIGRSEAVTLPRTGNYVLVIDSDTGIAGFTQSYTLRLSTATTSTSTIIPRTLPGSVPGRRTYTYDAAFSQKTGMTDELGRQTLYMLDPTNGNRLSMTHVIGAVGGDDDLVTTYTYTSDELLDTITDPLGRVTDNDYDSHQRLVTVTYAKGTPDEAAIHYEYDAAGNVSAMIDELGRRTEYQYDAVNRLTRVTEADPDGAGPLSSPVSTLTYDAVGNLLTETDSRGNMTRHEYDSRNRVTRTIDAVGNSMRYEYDARGNQSAMIDRLGRRTTYEYDARNRVFRMTDALGNRTTYEYDVDDNLLAMSDSLGNRTSYAYDARGRQIATTDALGNSERWEYDPVDNVIGFTDRAGRESTYAYDEVDRLVLRTDALGGTVQLAYDKASNVTSQTDELGRVTQTAFDNRNRPVQVTDANAGVMHIAYDDVSNVVSNTDELGRVTSFDYDHLNRLTQTTDALGGKASFTFDAVGNQLTASDPLQRTTRFSYDTLNRLIEVADPLQHATQFEFDAEGNLLSATDALGRQTSFTYDALNRRTAIRDPLGGVTATAFDAVGNPLSMTDELGRKSQYTYDALNRPLTSSDPLGQTTTLAFDAVGNVTSRQDALGHVTAFVYDRLNRQVKATDPDGGVTDFQFDAVGNLTKLTDPVSNATSFAYDALNRMTSETNSLDATRSLQYDATGNLVAVKDRNDRTSRFTYDGLNRQTREEWLDGTGTPLRTIQFSFDAASQMTAASDPASSYAFTFDAAGRPTQITNAGTPGVPAVQFALTYDNVNNRLSRAETIAGQAAATEGSAYDALNRLTRKTQSGPGTAAKRVDFAYDAASQPTAISRFTDLSATQAVAASSFTYDTAGRLTAITHAKGPTNLAAYTWAFDSANRLTQTSTPDGTTTYSYDDRDQLVAADHSFQTDETYTYDANGNRTTAGYETSENNRLLTDGTFSYEYDGEGNRIRRTENATGTVTEFTWDYRNRLTQVVEKNVGGTVLMDAQYTYDVFDRRIAKTVDADGAGPVAPATDRFVYDGPHIALQFDGTGQRTHRYLQGPAIDQILADENATGEVLWPLSDHLGTVRDLADSTGAVVNHLVYDSFGQVTSETNAAIDHLFGFTGREHDDETGLDYYRARYYDASNGRFISEDPIGFGGGDANVNRYVGNSPTMLIDPLGLKGSCPPKSPPNDDDDDHDDDDIDPEWKRRKKEWEDFQREWDRYRDYMKDRGVWNRDPKIPDFSNSPHVPHVPETTTTTPTPTPTRTPTPSPALIPPSFVPPPFKPNTDNRTPNDSFDGEPQWNRDLRDVLRKADQVAKNILDGLGWLDGEVGKIDPNIQQHARDLDNAWWMQAIKIFNQARGGVGQIPKP